jgi:acetyltransferase-like isoleucine patch superfamily enzyme
MCSLLLKVRGFLIYTPIKLLAKKALCLFHGVKHTGSNVFISPSAIIRNGYKIQLGNNVVIEKNVTLFPEDKQSFIHIGANSYLSSNCIIKTFNGWIKIGNNCTVNEFSILLGHGGLEIGNDVRIAPQVKIVAMNHVFDDPKKPIRLQDIRTIGIKIEDDVWLGVGATILDGVTIGKGSVIGAGAVVTKSIPQYSVAVGVPAKVMKERR